MSSRLQICSSVSVVSLRNSPFPCFILSFRLSPFTYTHRHCQPSFLARFTELTFFWWHLSWALQCPHQHTAHLLQFGIMYSTWSPRLNLADVLYRNTQVFLWVLCPSCVILHFKISSKALHGTVRLQASAHYVTFFFFLFFKGD